MKITLSWLKDHLEITASAEEIAERLTALGLEVESVEKQGLPGFVVAQVLSAEKHPNADRLRVCMVDIGRDDPIQVVCGAPNARAGMKSVFAAPGTLIPGSGIELKEGTIRGIASKGMLCSARELGLGEEHDGIMDLASDAPLGESFGQWRQLDDVLFDINVTPDRADALSVFGIARDLAASGMGHLKNPVFKKIPGAFPSPLQWRKETEGVIAVKGRYFRNLKNGESPEWLKKRLQAVGQRSISALVDITNYLAIDRGRPLHVFDADKIAGKDLIVRDAKANETLMALDGNPYALKEGMLVIADQARPLALGGIMGGVESGCSAETTNVFLEVALFEPKNIARTGRLLNLQSDARYRFERGIDPQSLDWGMDRASELILEICGGEASEIAEAGTLPLLPPPISYRPQRVLTLGGIAVEEKRQSGILQALGFQVEEKANGTEWSVVPPSWRMDVTMEADVVEEILRVEGFDTIPSLSLPRTSIMPQPALHLLQRRVQGAKRLLAGRGLMEAVTYSFMQSDLAKAFLSTEEPILLANPISSDLDAMRPSILGNLLQAAQRNASRGLGNIGLFEIGPVYREQEEKGQWLTASGLRMGDALPKHWQGVARPVDFFDVKADCFSLLERFGMPVENLQILPEAPSYYHPGRSAVLRLGPTILGYCGEIHPALLERLDLSLPAAGFEIFMERIAQPRGKGSATRPLLKASPYQIVERDFAFVVDSAQPFDKMLKAAKSADKDLIQSVRLFDVYQGKNLPEGKKSLGITVTLQASDRTLTDKEIESVSGRVIAAIAKATGAELRK